MEGIWLARPEQPDAGEPVAVKDLLDTAGLTTTYGSALFADHVPAVSADSVRLLEEAGYAVAGKTNLHEFAYGISSQNAHYGTVPNPVAPGRLDRVRHRAVVVVLRGDPVRELVQVRLPGHREPGLLEQLNRVGAHGGDVVGEQRGPVRRRQSRRVEQVLHRHRLARAGLVRARQPDPVH